MNMTEQSYFTQIKKMNTVYCCSSSQGKKKKNIYLIIFPVLLKQTPFPPGVKQASILGLAPSS